MTTSRIYAYRWPARLVSHKPFAAERYSITSSCIWQVFFRKNADFLFYFALFHLPGYFLCRMHNRAAAFSVENPADTSMPPGAGPYTCYIAKRGRPGWFPKAAPVRGLYFFFFFFFSASGTSGSRPELRSAAGSQGRCAPEQTSCHPLPAGLPPAGWSF